MFEPTNDHDWTEVSPKHLQNLKLWNTKKKNKNTRLQQQPTKLLTKTNRKRKRQKQQGPAEAEKKKLFPIDEDKINNRRTHKKK